MRPPSQEAEILLEGGNIAVAELVRFEFTTGTYGFWSGGSDFEYNGLTYVPGGIISISAIDGQWGMAAQGLTMKLAARPEDGLTPEVLATILEEGWHQRPVIVSEALFSPETGALLDVETIYRGSLDTLDFQDGPETVLIAYCESRALDNNREGYRMRSLNDQYMINPGDNFYSFTESAAKTVVPWGQNRQA